MFGSKKQKQQEAQEKLRLYELQSKKKRQLSSKEKKELKKLQSKEQDRRDENLAFWMEVFDDD